VDVAIAIVWCAASGGSSASGGTPAVDMTGNPLSSLLEKIEHSNSENDRYVYIILRSRHITR